MTTETITVNIKFRKWLFWLICYTLLIPAYKLGFMDDEQADKAVAALAGMCVSVREGRCDNAPPAQ